MLTVLQYLSGSKEVMKRMYPRNEIWPGHDSEIGSVKGWCEMIVDDAVLHSYICYRYSKVRTALTKEMELEAIIQGVSTSGQIMSYSPHHATVSYPAMKCAKKSCYCCSNYLKAATHSRVQHFSHSCLLCLHLS